MLFDEHRVMAIEAPRVENPGESLREGAEGETSGQEDQEELSVIICTDAGDPEAKFCSTELFADVLPESTYANRVCALIKKLSEKARARHASKPSHSNTGLSVGQEVKLTSAMKFIEYSLKPKGGKVHLFCMNGYPQDISHQSKGADPPTIYDQARAKDTKVPPQQKLQTPYSPIVLT